MSAGRSEKGSERDYLNKSLDKSLSILDFFDPKNSKLSVTEIARKCDTNPSSLYPILHTLEKYGYLKRDGDKLYKLGLAFAKKGRLVLDRLSVSVEARSELEKLRDEAEKTVHLGCLRDNQLIYIDKVEFTGGIRMYSSPGKTAPLHATALGKAILAFLPKDKLKAILSEIDLTSCTKNTIKDRTHLLKELDTIRKRNYAVDNEEFEEGIKCIASPIHGHDGNVKAAVSLTGLAAQIGDEEVRRMASLVETIAGNISSKLGYECSKG